MAESKMTKAKREEVENLIYKVFDTIDNTHTNSDYYRELFSKMSDDQLYNFMKRRLPFRFHQEIFKIEPSMEDVAKAMKLINVPMTEKLILPYVYKNEQGVPVNSKECMIIYIHIKRMKQMLSKKNNASMHVDNRDMRTGLLMQGDKAAKETDREFESLASYGLDYTMDEFRTIKADSMKASAEAVATVLDKGSVSEKDYTVKRNDSLSRNMLNVYLVGANIHSNLIDEEYMTPYTAKNKQEEIDRG